MKLSEIGNGLRLNSEENISDGDLKSFVKQYPFSSTLRLLHSKRELESMHLDQVSDLTLAVFNSNSTAVLESFFSFPDKGQDLQIEDQYIQDDHADVDEDIVVDVPQELESTIDESNVQAKQTEVIEESSSSVDKNVEDPARTSKVLSELDHLSDYSAWLLQLNQSENSAKVQMSDESVLDKNEEVLVNQKREAIKDKSSELNSEIASESLANLLLDQGHYNKAREMYRKLSLIIPEKSAYFAVQIEKIKGK